MANGARSRGEGRVIFVLTFLAFALIVAAMSVGVMAGRDPKGVLRRYWALGIDQSCEIWVVIHSAVKPKRSDSSKPGAIESILLVMSSLWNSRREATEFQ